jgi:hypothetical protein
MIRMVTTRMLTIHEFGARCWAFRMKLLKGIKGIRQDDVAIRMIAYPAGVKE